MSTSNLHPVLRYAGVLVCFLLAGATLVISFLANPHSTAWLLAFYVTLVLFPIAFRRRHDSTLNRAYAIHLALVSNYLFMVWFLHVWVPGSHPERVGPQVTFWAEWS